MKKPIDNTDHCPNCHSNGRGKHGCGGNYTEIEKKCVICHPECERCKYGCLWAGMNNSGCPCKCHSEKEDTMYPSKIIEVDEVKSKLIISHGDSHPFGEKCKTCDKIKKQYKDMIKKALPTHKGGVLTRNEVKKILDNL